MNGTAEERGKKKAANLEQQLKLNVFVIDAGWHTMAHNCLAAAIPLMKDFLAGHNLFILSQAQSVAFLKRHPKLLGKDPIVAVVDSLALRLNNPSGYGARLCLGLFESSQKINWMLKMFLRIVNTHASTLDIAYTFRVYSHKEGIRGAVEIIMESLGPKRA